MKSVWILSVVILSLGVFAVPVGVHVTNDSGQVLWVSFFGKNYQNFERDHYEPIEIERHEIAASQSVFIPFTSKFLPKDEVVFKITFSNIGFSYACWESKVEKQAIKLQTDLLYEVSISSEYGYWPQSYLLCSVRSCD